LFVVRPSNNNLHFKEQVKIFKVSILDKDEIRSKSLNPSHLHEADSGGRHALRSRVGSEAEGGRGHEVGRTPSGLVDSVRSANKLFGGRVLWVALHPEALEDAAHGRGSPVFRLLQDFRLGELHLVNVDAPFPDLDMKNEILKSLFMFRRKRRSLRSSSTTFFSEKNPFGTWQYKRIHKNTNFTRRINIISIIHIYFECNKKIICGR
jgi:hypothetical protein